MFIKRIFLISFILLNIALNAEQIVSKKIEKTQNIDTLKSDLKPAKIAPFCLIKIEPTNQAFEGKLFYQRDKKDYFAFIVEMPETSAKITINPKIFQIHKDQKYYVDSGVYDPFIIKAKESGSLTFDVPACYYNQIIISPTGENLIPSGNMESAKDFALNWQIIDNSKPLPILNWGHEEFSYEGNLQGLSSESIKNTASIRSKRQRSGNSSLSISKLAPKGAIVIKTRDIKLKSGKKYLLTAYYNTTNKKFGSGFSKFIRLSADNNKKKYVYSTVMARNTCEHQWRMAFLWVSVPKDWENPKLSIYLTATGEPFELSWDDFDLRESPVLLPQECRPPRKEQISPLISKDELCKKLEAAKPYTAERKIINGFPQLFLNGELSPKFGYVGFLRAGHKDFDENNVHLQWLSVSTGSTGVDNWRGACLWEDDGIYDFSSLDTRLEKLLRLAPKAVIMLYLNLSPSRKFLENHPDSISVDIDGKKRDRKKRENNYWASNGDKVYYEATARMLEALCKHLKTSLYGKAVAGFHLVGGYDGQWFPWKYDGSEGYRQAFIEYLRKEYGSINNLRKAWGDSDLNFKDIKYPKPTDKKGLFFLDPENPDHKKFVDAERFRNLAPVKFVSGLGCIVKKAMQRPFYISMYYCDISCGHDMGKCALKEVLESPYIDGIVGVLPYGGYRVLGQSGGVVNLVSSPGLNEKILLGELDYRTEYSDIWSPRNAPGWNSVVVGQTRGRSENLFEQIRDTGIFLAKHQGAWMFALAGNGWAHKDMLSNINQANNAAKMSAECPFPQDYGDLAYFVDEHELDYLGYGEKGTRFDLLISQVGALWGSQSPIYLSGLKYEQYLLSDLMNQKRKKSKINVFGLAASISEKQINWIENNLQKDNNILVFCFDTGRATPGGFSKNIKRLTGINAVIDEKKLITYKFEPLSLQDDLSKTLKYLGTSTMGPAFIVKDKSATPLAVYQDTKLIAAAIKRHKNWTGVYIGAPGGITPEFLNAIAREVNIKPVGPVGDATFAGNGFITIHALSSGKKTLSWNKKCNLIDISTGKVVASNTNSYVLDMKVGESRWFRKQ